MINHSLFQRMYSIVTLFFIMIFSLYFPIIKSKKFSFAEICKLIFGFLSFLLAIISFLFIEGNLIERLKAITDIQNGNLAGTVILLYILALALFIFSYLSDNTKNEKQANTYYKFLIFCMLFFLCLIVSLVGSLISYFTYVPGP